MKRAKKYTVGFVGLGIMGKPMVINLIKKNIEIYFYARKRRIINQIIDMGGHYVSSIKELTKYSDIFITNLPNTPREKLGLTDKIIRKLNPKIIYASLTGYGENGPDSNRTALDATAYFGRSGLMHWSKTNEPEETPPFPIPGGGDHPTGLSLFTSILLALMASGMNGQCFSFNGYLPIETSERKKKLQKLEKNSRNYNQTQIFIETPYRNNKLIDAIYQNLQGNTKLCIACDLSLNSEYIKTKTVYEWKKAYKPDLKKRPCIFLIHAH